MRSLPLFAVFSLLAAGCVTCKTPAPPPAAKTIKYSLPNAGWTLAAPDQVPMGFDALALHETTKSAILFNVFHGEHVLKLAMMMRDSYATSPGTKVSPFVISDEKGTVSFTIETWTTDKEPRLVGKAKVTVRRLPGAPDTEVSALGGWDPQFDADMTKDFEAIIMAVKNE